MTVNEFDVPTGFWRAACEDADHPLACVGLDHRFKWVNSAFERLVGWSVVELTGRTWMEITVQGDVGGDLASIEAVMSGKVTHYTMSKSYIHRRGHAVPVELTVRRFPPNVIDDVLCFRVEAPPAKATRPELDQVEKSLLRMISELRVKVETMDEHQPRHDRSTTTSGVTVNTGDTNSDRAMRYQTGALVAIAGILAYLFYYVATLPKQDAPAPPPSPIIQQQE